MDNAGIKDNDGGGTDADGGNDGAVDDDGGGTDANCGIKDDGPRDGKVDAINGPGMKDDPANSGLKEDVNGENDCNNVKVH